MLRIDNTTLKARVRDVEDDIKKEKLDALLVYANGSALRIDEPHARLSALSLQFRRSQHADHADPGSGTRA